MQVETLMMTVAQHEDAIFQKRSRQETRQKERNRRMRENPGGRGGRGTALPRNQEKRIETLVISGRR